jgi:hypothetical protein
MHEFASAERYANVRRTTGHRLEENEIPRPNLIPFDAFPLVVLLSRFAGKRRAMLRKHPLDEPAAVEAVRRLTASVQIRCAAQSKRRRNQRGRGRCGFGR